MLVFKSTQRQYIKGGHGVFEIIPRIIGKSAKMLLSKALQVGKNTAKPKGEELIQKAAAKLIQKTVNKVKPGIKKFTPIALTPQAEKILQKHSIAGQNLLINSGKQILDKYLIGSGIVFD